MSENYISILNELIQVTKDSEEGFMTAKENVEDPSLKEVFMERAQRCKNIIVSLQNKVLEEKGDPELRGSLLGAMHRAWINIKGTLTGKDDHSILVECERGEDAVKAAYSKVLENNLPMDIRSLIEKHYEEIKKDHDLVRDLRDSYAKGH